MPLKKTLPAYYSERFEYISYLFEEGLSPDEILPELTTSEIYFFLTGALDYGTEFRKIETEKVSDELSKRKKTGIEILEDFPARIFTVSKPTYHISDSDQIKMSMLPFYKKWFKNDKEKIQKINEIGRSKKKLNNRYCPDNLSINTVLHIPKEKKCCISLMVTDYKTEESIMEKEARKTALSIEKANSKGLKGKEFEEYVFKESMMEDVLRSRAVVGSEEKCSNLAYFFKKMRGFGVYEIEHRKRPRYQIPLSRVVIALPEKIVLGEKMIEPKDHMICQQIMTRESDYEDRMGGNSPDGPLPHSVYETRRLWEPFNEKSLKRYNKFLKNYEDFRNPKSSA